jgi:hypothetical protein
MTIDIEFNDLLTFVEAGMRGSHLKWHIVERAINEFYHNMDSIERNMAYERFKSIVDQLEGWNEDINKQLLYRYNPNNQYNVKIVNGKTVSCYYDLSQDRFCIKIGFSINPEYIKTITKI